MTKKATYSPYSVITVVYDEFKIQAVKQVTEQGYIVASVSKRLWVFTNSLYNWMKKYGSDSKHYQQMNEQEARKRELEKRAGASDTGTRYLKGSRVFRQRAEEKYAFIKSRLDKYPVRLMCQILSIQRSGFYAWLKQPKSARTIEDERLLGLIKHYWLESGCVYGYRKVQSDLRDLGETCSKHRVARLMRQEGLKAQVGYKKHRGMYSGQPALIAENILDREFSPSEQNQSWVTDITYIRTHEG